MTQSTPSSSDVAFPSINTSQIHNQIFHSFCYTRSLKKTLLSPFMTEAWHWNHQLAVHSYHCCVTSPSKLVRVFSFKSNCIVQFVKVICVYHEYKKISLRMSWGMLRVESVFSQLSTFLPVYLSVILVFFILSLSLSLSVSLFTQLHFQYLKLVTVMVFSKQRLLFSLFHKNRHTKPQTFYILQQWGFWQMKIHCNPSFWQQLNWCAN